MGGISRLVFRILSGKYPEYLWAGIPDCFRKVSGIPFSRSQEIVAQSGGQRRRKEPTAPEQKGAPRLGNHSFRTIGIMAYLRNGGTLKKAAQMANHASTGATQFYDRRREELSIDEVGRIRV